MEKPEIRKPVVAGQFYPSSKEAINKQIGEFVDKKVKKLDALACMLPHAGYIFSGAVAAQTVAGINIKDKIVLFEL